jgi:hypothetical protein
MTVKDLRIQYCQSATNCPFTELFNLDINNNEEDVELYVDWLENKVLDLISKIPNSNPVKT